MLGFKEKFMILELALCESSYWVWSLRPQQVTLGAGILSLKRKCPLFSELELCEFEDLGLIVKIIEKTLSKTFDYNKINYLMLMMIDEQVHFHVIPRYQSAVNLFGYQWNDIGWPGQPNLGVIRENVDLLKIKKHIMQQIKSIKGEL